MAPRVQWIREDIRCSILPTRPMVKRTYPTIVHEYQLHLTELSKTKDAACTRGHVLKRPAPHRRARFIQDLNCKTVHQRPGGTVPPFIVLCQGACCANSTRASADLESWVRRTRGNLVTRRRNTRIITISHFPPVLVSVSIRIAVPWIGPKCSFVSIR